mmetsp:Transcript_124284/g.247740  ORF Transcript_124284/g.247740 Transcript_124284/m.247740 type:complete len:102 (+) Transcript_124284:1458-1763(+)
MAALHNLLAPLASAESRAMLQELQEKQELRLRPLSAWYVRTVWDAHPGSQCHERQDSMDSRRRPASPASMMSLAGTTTQASLQVSFFLTGLEHVLHQQFRQ